jgi:hypothetical protein
VAGFAVKALQPGEVSAENNFIKPANPIRNSQQKSS